MFFSQVIAIQPVEITENIGSIEEQLFPARLRRRAAVRCDRVGEDDPGPPSGEVHAGQHISLCAVDVDLEKMDWPSDVIFKNSIERLDDDRMVDHVEAIVAMLLRRRGVDCRSPFACKNLVEGALSFSHTSGDMESQVARSLALEKIAVPG